LNRSAEGTNLYLLSSTNSSTKYILMLLYTSFSIGRNICLLTRMRYKEYCEEII